MTSQARIEKGLYWDRAWSLVEGCTPASEGCAHCWAASQTHMRARQSNEKIRARYGGLTDAGGRFNGKIRLMEESLRLPLSVRKPTTWAVWNDLFHEDVPASFIQDAYDVMGMADWHTFIILTKRPGRIVPVLYGQEHGFHLGGGDYWPNIWHLVTAEDHVRLAGVLSEIEGMAIISSYQNHVYDDILDGWHTIEKKVRTERGQFATEVLWISPACEAARLPLFAV